jgi:hypothetical protein
MFSETFDKRVRLFLTVLALTTLSGTAFGLYVLWPANQEEGYRPVQPLDYSHKMHAGDLQIECLYCHTGADQGAHAPVPSLATCMKCHTEVQTKDSKGRVKPELAKLLEHWRGKKPIQWVKVNDLADFVYFDHSRHTNWYDPELGRSRERLECQECHGPVEEMEVLAREYSLKMGWCLECHMEPPQEDTWPGLETRAPIHCSTCHR